MTMALKMLVYEGAGVNADTLRIIVKDNESTAFDKKYYCGYDYSWSESFATPEKPLKRNLIQQIADRFGVKDIEYLEGKRLVF